LAVTPISFAFAPRLMPAISVPPSVRNATARVHEQLAGEARVFTLNLRNRLIFKAADEEGAVESAEFFGKAKMIKKSWGYSGGRRSRNYSEHDEHKIKPHVLRNYPKYTAFVVHCERGHRRKLLPPIERMDAPAPGFVKVVPTERGAAHYLSTCCARIDHRDRVHLARLRLG
jgi:hypothetical protein